MSERTISCSSLSKTYSITGWRIGYIIAPKQIIEGARKIHDFLTVGAAAPLQEAALVALGFADEYYAKLKEDYTERRNYFLNGLDKLNLKYSTPQGAYYVLVDISEFGAESDLEFCEWMAEEIGVAAVPGLSFFKEDIQNYIRFHFAKSNDTLTEALQRLEQLHIKAKKKYKN
jgi:aminotransferase